jgi:hypothetical protein
MSSSVKLWTADRVDRSKDGNAEGLDLVFIVVNEVSMEIKPRTSSGESKAQRGDLIYLVPLFFVPQTAHIKMAFLSPEEPPRRSPQSVQKSSDPTAAMFVVK